MKYSNRPRGNSLVNRDNFHIRGHFFQSHRLPDWEKKDSDSPDCWHIEDSKSQQQAVLLLFLEKEIGALENKRLYIDIYICIVCVCVCV